MIFSVFRRMQTALIVVCLGSVSVVAPRGVVRAEAAEKVTIAPPPMESKPELQLATFACDITPPLGHPLCGGWIKALEGVDDPQLAKGLILRDAGGTYVLCVLDWCELRNDAYELFRRRIAEAVAINPEFVAVHCIHAHNAPITDRRAQEILGQTEGAPVHADLSFLDSAAERVAASAREATKLWVGVTHVGTSRARVERVASNRRVKQADGSIKVRYSSTKDPELHAAPEGKVDPWLRTVSFHDGDRALACVHYYATHPQSYYGDGRATPDVPGIARERLEGETGTFQLYFTGCAGDVTAGKYNDGSPPRREELVQRIVDAMRRSVESVELAPSPPIGWRLRRVQFPLRKEAAQSASAKRKVLADPNASAVQRIGAALDLSTTERCEVGIPFELTCMELGRVRLLHLPGEPFVDFQIQAQEERPDLFVAVAGYADCGVGYLCTETSYAEGGYEPTATLLDPVSEHYLRRAIRDLLSKDVPPTAARALSVKRIWDSAPHSAFTDLTRHRDEWLCAFREGAGHVSPEGDIRVLRSPEGESWESAAVLHVDDVDLRDPKVCRTPDGRLMMVGGWRQWPPAHQATLRTFVAFSEDGLAWSEPVMVLDEGWWLWRAVWLGDEAFGVAYGRPEEGSGWESALFSSPDGIGFRKVVDFTAAPGLTEATLCPDVQGRLRCLHRRDAGTRTALLGTSHAPYTEWAWKDSGFYLGGPNALLHEGRWYAAGRWMVGPPKTVLACLDWDLGTIEPILDLPSGGDTSYPGLVSYEGELWISYYSSHEGKTAIYLARVRTSESQSQ